MKTFLARAESSRLFNWGAPALWFLSYFAVRGALESFEMSNPVRVAVALIPVLPAVVFIWLVVAGISSLDELERRIHLEALALAFPLAMLLLMILGLLDLAVPLSPDDWSYRHIWPYLMLLYLLGLTRARRRYG